MWSYNIGLVPIEDKIREVKLTYFGYIKRRDTNTPMWRFDRIDLLKCKRGKGKAKKNWNEMIKYDMRRLILIKEMNEGGIFGGLE